MHCLTRFSEIFYFIRIQPGISFNRIRRIHCFNWIQPDLLFTPDKAGDAFLYLIQADLIWHIFRFADVAEIEYIKSNKPRRGTIEKA